MQHPCCHLKNYSRWVLKNDDNKKLYKILFCNDLKLSKKKIGWVSSRIFEKKIIFKCFQIHERRWILKKKQSWVQFKVEDWVYRSHFLFS